MCAARERKSKVGQGREGTVTKENRETRTERTYASGVFSIFIGALGPPGGLLRALLRVWRATGEEAMVGESGV